MRRSSWIVLGICVLLSAGLVFAYLSSRVTSDTLTQQQATQIIHQLQDDVTHKRVNDIMSCIATGPDVRIANMRVEQLRLLMVHAFRSTGHLTADCNNITFAGGQTDATVAFDLVVRNVEPNMIADDYTGHITLQLRRVPVSHLMGIYQTKEWRITAADTTGKDPSTYGDY